MLSPDGELRRPTLARKKAKRLQLQVGGRSGVPASQDGDNGRVRLRCPPGGFTR
jgi:hypothetical protein